MVKTIKPKWMKKTTKQAIEDKKSIRKVHGDHSAQYKIAKSETKKFVRKDKIEQIEKECDVLNQLSSDKQFYAAVKSLKTNKRCISWGVKNINNEILTNKDDILEQWATYYETPTL